MKRNIMLLWLFFIIVSANAQDTLQQERVSLVTVDLFTPVLSFAPRWTAGYIRSINERWLGGIEVGYGTYTTAVKFTDHSDFYTSGYRLFEVRPSLYYNLRPHKKLKHLLSLELFYINHKDNFTTDSYYSRSELRKYRYDSADTIWGKDGLCGNR